MEEKFVWVFRGVFSLQIFDTEEKARKAWLDEVAQLKSGTFFADGRKVEIWQFNDDEDCHMILYSCSADWLSEKSNLYSFYSRYPVR